jgi:hypothetical protein
MTEQNINKADYERAQEIVRANLSPRYKRLDELEGWVTGAAYAGRKNFWDDSVPLWEREPCIQYPVVRIAIESNVDLVLGEGRFPAFTSKPGEDEAEQDNGLGEKDSETLDRFLGEHHRLCRFRAHCRDAFSAAQACGTAVALHGVRNRTPFADLIPAKWATPRLGISGEVLSLEIKYPYLDEYRKADGTWSVRPKLYRRTIDAQSDVTYKPADARESGLDPKWEKDPDRDIRHGLGFCPAVWYPFMRGCVPVNVIDGKALHAAVIDEIQAHDIALSQKHRGALFSEPQMCEIGVSPGYNPTAALGRMPLVPSHDADGKANGGYGQQPTGDARKKGPGYVNQYTDPETKVQYLCYPPEALKAQDDNARDLRTKLMQSLAVVLLDHEGIAGIRQLSGKALEAIKQAQIDRCDQFRDDLRDGFLLPSIDMQLRIVAKQGASLRVPGSAQIAGVLKKFDKPEIAATKAGSNVAVA